MATSSWRVGGAAWRAARPLPWPGTAPGFLVAAVASARMALRVARHEALKDGSYLVPVRAFIGIGWLRAFAEKVGEPGWRDGASLAAFLDQQERAGMVVFPLYQALAAEVFLGHALALGWLVMLGQLLAGVAILTGALTTAALLGGIFMNLNFLLAGAPDPSAFYIVIQAVLLLAGTGAILGVDARLARRPRLRSLAARPPGLQPLSIEAPAAVALMALACGGAVYAAAHVRDWTPAGSVHDPAAVLAVLAGMAASWFAIVALRGLPQTAYAGSACAPHSLPRSRTGRSIR